MADHAALRMLALALTRLMRSPDELVAITVSGGTARRASRTFDLEVLALGSVFLHELRALVAAAILEELEALAVGMGHRIKLFQRRPGIVDERRAKLSPSGAGS